ncbi:alpha/beta hydrolase family protein [Nocardiopsis sp. N85]|uniref:alpha/beta hydrolase family protein n=1 Tax=Nocardiopsis sp. N85 TaxID=3029400 RepID=UPI00406CD6EE
MDRAVAQGCTDPDRVGIHGSSYGGYATLVGAAFTPDRFAAAVGHTGRSGPVDPTEGIVPFALSGLVNDYLRYFGGRSSTTSRPTRHLHRRRPRPAGGRGPHELPAARRTRPGRRAVRHACSAGGRGRGGAGTAPQQDRDRFRPARVIDDF